MGAIKKVVVTGGVGALGRYVVDELSAHYEVTVISRRIPVEDAKTRQVDVRDLGALKQAFSGQDAVVHLAGLDSVVDASPGDFIDVNTFGTWCVFEAAKESAVQHVVYCSSASVYGLDHTNPAGTIEKLPVDESHRLLTSHPYGLSKRFSETIAESYAQRFQMNVCSLRVSAVVFPETVEELVAVLEEDADTWQGLLAETVMASSHGSNYNVPLYRSYIDANDAAGAFRCALETSEPGYRVFNICASDTLVPTGTLDLVSSIKPGQLPEYDAGRYASMPRAAVFSNDKAQRELGWQPKKTWAEMSVAYFQDH